MKLCRLAIAFLVFSLIAPAAFAVLPSKPAQTESRMLKQARQQMQDAADERRVGIETREMLTVVRDDITLLVAPLEGFEQVPATAALGGVDIGFAYIEAPLSDIPTGYYTLRGSARNVAEGTVAGNVELIDDNGRVTGTLPAELRINSLEVPESPRFNRTLVGGGIDADHLTGHHWVNVWIICPNGMVICFVLHTFQFQPF